MQRSVICTVRLILRLLLSHDAAPDQAYKEVGGFGKHEEHPHSGACKCDPRPDPLFFVHHALLPYHVVSALIRDSRAAPIRKMIQVIYHAPVAKLITKYAATTSGQRIPLYVFMRRSPLMRSARHC